MVPGGAIWYNMSMHIWVVIGFSLLTVVLLVVAAARPKRSGLSTFELERRKAAGNHTAADELRREVLLDDVESIKQLLQATVLVLVVAAAITAFGPGLGVLVGVVVALAYGPFTRIEIIQTIFGKPYESVEQPLLQFIERHPRLCKLLRSIPSNRDETGVSSREEFLHLVEHSGRILTEDERKLIANGLAFDERTVESVMTPRGVIESVAVDELAGPLLLDSLHRTGHSRFPVIDGDIDHVVGMLHIRELLTAGSKDSPAVKDAMEKRVYYINESQNLQHALAAFLKTRHHLFVVVNGYRETSGLLSIEDVIEALLGRKIIDEYDVHDDLRVAAERGAKHNNNSPSGKDV